MNFFCLAIVSSTFLWVKLGAVTIQTNVDIDEPSVIRSPDLGRNDGFGWTAVFHDMQAGNTRIIIGAPKGTYPGGLNLPTISNGPVNETGLVYSCQFGSGLCEGITGDTARYVNDPLAVNAMQVLDRSSATIDMFSFNQAISEGRLFDQAPNARDTGVRRTFDFENKNGQLMGSTIYSNGENVIACAPSWASSVAVNQDRSDPRGICFIGDRSLTNFRTLVPCGLTAGSSDTATGSSYCLGGFSAVLVNEFIAVGGPGNEQFAGSVASRRVVSATTDFTLYSPNAAVSLHLGFQITKGYISSNTRTPGQSSDLIVSTPRYNGTLDYNGRVDVFATSDLPLQTSSTPAQTMNGNQTSEFFGYSLATCDITGDGYDELLVGAPMYTLVDGISPEVGRLFIFYNTGGSLDTDNPLIIPGKVPYARFGFSVANAGDLDSDGHEDFVVGAPYELSESSSSSTGAVYVYYGRDTKEDLSAQQPQKISANDVVDSVSTFTQLRSFGFSLAGGIDLDGNNHTDFMIGAPEEQAVILLRTFPFVNVSISIENVTPINLDRNSSFMVSVTGMYRSALIEGPLVVKFNLTERRGSREANRLFFAENDRNDVFGEGEFNFTASDTPFMSTIQIFVDSDISNLNNYELDLSLVDVPRNIPPVVGNEVLSVLTSFPRFRLQGNSTLEVAIIDPCGEEGCASDLFLMDPVPDSITITASSTPLPVEFQLTYSNIGPEEGRDLRLIIFDLPTQIFTGVSLVSVNTSVNFICTFGDPGASVANATCELQDRLRPGVLHISTLSLFLTSSIIGNEDPLDIAMEILLDRSEGSNDNLANNRINVRFLFDSEADINTDLGFSLGSISYTGESPGDDRLGDGVSLTVTVGNTGPSIIQNATVFINFPSRFSDITGNNFFLYPSTLTLVNRGGVTVDNCSLVGLNPEGRNNLGSDLITNRKRRSAEPVFTTSTRAKRHAARARQQREVGMSARHKRQENDGDFTLDCATATSCDTFSCDISRLSTEGVMFTLVSFLDERFYSTRANSREFILIATSSVVIRSDFQVSDDDSMNNRGTARIRITPPPPEEERSSLIHVILWPTIGAILILIILVVLLYCLGFFRRKKRDGEGEVAGDFEPPEQEKPQAVPETSPEATTV